jgi:iron complex transport system substrate-binding protein
VRFGELAGTEAQARAAAAAFSERLARLRARYSARRPVKVFWQIWSLPLMTINGRHFISDVIRLCGGVNVFADLPSLVPSISVEAVMAANSDAIVTTTADSAADGSDGLDAWRRLKSLRATAPGNLIGVIRRRKALARTHAAAGAYRAMN